MEVKRTKSIQDATQIELLNAKLAKADATIDYLAMMSDIDLPSEESEVIEDEQEV